MGWIASVRCQKLRCKFVAKTFALIAPVQPISYQVSCSNETIKNAPKHYKMHQLMSLASNGVDRVRSLRKTLMRFCGTNFFINCTSSTHFAPSFLQQRNKYKMHPNTTKHTNSCVQRPMSWIRCVRCEKLSCNFVARTSSLIAPIQPVLLRVSCSNETIQNAPKHCETQKYMSLGSNGVGRVHLLRKIP